MGIGLPDASPDLRTWQSVTKQSKLYAVKILSKRYNSLRLLQVIVERYHKEKNLSQLDKTKFLVPEELTISQFVTIIR